MTKFFAVRSYAALIYYGGLRLRIRISFGVRIWISKLLESNYNPTVIIMLT